MFPKPVLNDAENPLVSVLIYDYCGRQLEHCLAGILSQRVMTNLEVIYIDNASSDGAWEVALKYARTYNGIVTLKRNRNNGGIDNKRYAVRMAQGQYCVLLTDNEAFMPEYLQHCIQVMACDPYAKFDMVRRRVDNAPGRPNLKNKPLVSVLIHNYNYGRYLTECLQSVFSQTYDNFEIIFSDNASSDASWQIAVDFDQRYPGTMTLMRNRKNFGPNLNLENCYDNIHGKYFCVLCSDDAIEPTFIETCVAALEAHPNTGFAMTHRAIMDENSRKMEEPPFYNQSCLIPGTEQAAVYMMAAVNPSISQLMYNYAKAIKKLPSENILSRWFAQRILDFNLCCEFDVAYIKDPLILHRIHNGSDSFNIARSMVEAFGQYILPHQFVEIASSKNNMDKTIGRLPDALAKLSRLCLRYCVRALTQGDETGAGRYYYLSLAILPAIDKDAVFGQLQQYWQADQSGKIRILQSLKETANLADRTVSYDPPSGSQPLSFPGQSQLSVA